MDDMVLDQLDRKIQEALDLIVKLRSENAALKDELEKVRKSGSGKKTISKEQQNAYREDVQRLKKERAQIKQKVRNVLRKLEGIHMEEGMVQKDLFGPE